MTELEFDSLREGQPLYPVNGHGHPVTFLGCQTKDLTPYGDIIGVIIKDAHGQQHLEDPSDILQRYNVHPSKVIYRIVEDTGAEGVKGQADEAGVEPDPSFEAIRPNYYRLPNGIECEDVAQEFNFNLGNVIKYVWRAGKKSEQGMTDKEKTLQDLRKAMQYVEFEISRINRQ